MKLKVKSITGFPEAFESMFMSKRTWTPELGEEIDRVCESVLTRNGSVIKNAPVEDVEKFNKWLGMLLRMGKLHITVLRYLDIAIMTEGLHRAGQDDVDSHAKRFSNRIIRSSTRLAEYKDGEVSEWYEGKIIPTDSALKMLNIELPETITVNNETYCRAVNGYVKEEYKDNKDVKRGLYMLSIPSNFVSKIDLCEWGHVYQERGEHGTANPEVKMWAEKVMADITAMHPQITSEYVKSIKN